MANLLKNDSVARKANGTRRLVFGRQKCRLIQETARLNGLSQHYAFGCKSLQKRKVCFGTL